jgi:hypothetical protein
MTALAAQGRARIELDELVHLAEVHGWHVTDSRATRAVMWFSRGREYVHVGVNVEGELFSVYGGVRGRRHKYWAAGPVNHEPALKDRAAAIRAALIAAPFDTYDTRERD